ncbi:hypothetical protein GCM10008983_14710 [Lentibacillus halophilus]|uniref:Uncharacterized protein n=1 Tax=Lentibacillus halophilus TaxID=295065 RepID=A0ABN0Z8Q3_9BACI
MKGFIILCLGILTLLASIIFLYISYQPKVGPIGNGPNYTQIWITFSAIFLSGLLGIFRAVQEFMKK